MQQLPGAFLLTRIKSNLSIDNQSHTQSSVGWDYLQIPKFQRLCPIQRVDK